MRIVIATTFLLFGSAACAEDKPATIALKDFKFKVADNIAQLFGVDESGERLFFYTNGAAEVPVKITDDGEYTIKIKASCDSAQNERAKFKLSIDGELVGKETLLTQDDVKEYSFTAKLKTGERKLKIEFTNDVHKEGEYDRNLFVYAVSVKKEK